MKAVQFDMDGVLANFHESYRGVQRDLGLQETHDSTWNSYLDLRVWSHISASPNFWQSLLPLVDKYTFERIDDMQHRLPFYFVTSRPGVRADVQTRRWLQWHGVRSPQVIVSGLKAEVAKALNVGWSLEDKAGNAVAISYISRGTRSCLLDVPDGGGATHNQFDHSVIGGSVVRVKSVDAFLDIVSKEAA